MSHAASTVSGGVSGAAGGAALGATVAGPLGAAVGGVAGGVAGAIGGYLSADEDEARRKKARKRHEAREKRRQELIVEMIEQGRSGSQTMLTGLRQDIDRRFQKQSSGFLRDASGRGLVHSGYAGAMGRDLQRTRQESYVQAAAASQQHLLRALAMAQQHQAAGLSAEQSFDEMMYLARESGDDDLVSALLKLAPQFGEFMQEYAGQGGTTKWTTRRYEPRFEMVSD